MRGGEGGRERPASDPVKDWRRHNAGPPGTGAGPYDADAEAFAAIVAHLGDPEWRRLRRCGVAISALSVLVAAIVVRLLLGWPLAAVVTFALSAVAGLVGGLLAVGRSLFWRSW